MTPTEPGGPGGAGDRQLCRDDAAYVLGALPPADRHAYEDHLRECAACQASVRSLAGLPGLLALTSADVLAGPAEPVPPSVLPAVLGRVTRARRRRRWLVGSLAAAAVALLVVAIGAAVRPAPGSGEAGPGPSGTGSASVDPSAGSGVPGAPAPGATAPSPGPDETVPLDQVAPGPMTATLELVDRRWGTSITVVCSYAADMNDAVPYDLAVVDLAGHESSAGSWSGVPGVTARIPVATALPREQISAFEIRLADGRTILHGAP
ncbi:zf-HC2 domain-containing protein [Nakamurella sp.]|uniref:zf-HC2 domain-containing protein n=1 Tax=Nakamurella sp. TaxID=1869182 RepID=UPI003B3AC2D0